MARVPLRSRIPMNSIEFQRIPMEFYISLMILQGAVPPPPGAKRKKTGALGSSLGKGRPAAPGFPPKNDPA